MKDSTLHIIFDEAHAVVINMNDTFYYACADSSTIDLQDLIDLEPVIELYGRQAFIAYEAINRGHDPQITAHATNPRYGLAKEMIQRLMDEAEQYGIFFELRMKVKEVKALQVKERKKLARYKSRLRSWFSFFCER